MCDDEVNAILELKNDQEFSAYAHKLLALSTCTIDNCKTIMALCLQLDNDQIYQQTFNHVKAQWNVQIEKGPSVE